MRLQLVGSTRYLTLMLVAAGLAGCSVVSSSPVLEAGRSNKGCASRLGSYALPRQVLAVQIQSQGDNFILANLDTTAVPDNGHHYCLEHDNNPFAEDSIRVYKDKIVDDNSVTPTSYKASSDTVKNERTPFLQLVASKAVDHTAGIIRNFIRAIFIGLSNNPDFPGRAKLTPGDAPRIVADHQTDPFNYHEMAELNRSIRRFGFCIVLAGYTFNERALPAASYCDSPMRKAEQHAPPSDKAIQSMRWLAPKPAAGIFYRPRAPYNVEVYINHRPDDRRSTWHLALIKTVRMENIMPIVSVGVHRELFAERRTGLIFDDGELVNVCISKGNSIAGATNIVLDVVYGIVNLPAATMQGIISETNTRKDLTQKRIDLIKAQEAYIKYLEDENAPQVSNVSDKAGAALNLSENNRPAKAQKAADRVISDTPASAGAILQGGDPLADICAKLKAAKSPDISPGGTPATGVF